MKDLKSFKMLAVLAIFGCQNSFSAPLPDGSENLKGNPEYREMESYLKSTFPDFLSVIPPDGFVGFNKHIVYFRIEGHSSICEELLTMFKFIGSKESEKVFRDFYAKFEQKDNQALQAERARSAAQIARLEAEKKAAEIANAAQKASSEAEIARLRQEVADMDAKFEEIYQNLIPKNTWN